MPGGEMKQGLGARIRPEEPAPVRLAFFAEGAG